jgi:hypothetical protein
MYRKSITLIVLVVGMFAGLAQAQLITAVAHRNTDTDAPENPRIATTPLGEDAVVFVDRTHQYNEVPAFLVGAEYIMLANDNKNQSAYELDITFSRDATLYVFVDNRMGGAAGGLGVAPIITGMPWLTNMGFADTGEDIGIDESGDGDIDQYSSIFSLAVNAGTVTIGGNTQGHGGNMLGVAALPRSPATIARGPAPEDGAVDVPRDVVLAWQPGEGTTTRDVYLGTEFDDVNDAAVTGAMDALVSQGQADLTFQPENPLAYGQTYYWRIDEIDAISSEATKGTVWSFTVEPYAYPVENVTATASSAQANMGPANTVNGSGLNADDQHSTELKDTWLSSGTQPNWIQYEFGKVVKLDELWVWNSNQMIENILGFGAKDVTIEYSLDGAVWTELADVPEFAQATSDTAYACNTTVDFGGVLAKYVKLTINSTWGGGAITGLSEVRFFSVPVEAREPEPADATTGVEINTTLNWRPSREAASHTVYFGADANAVAEGTAAAKTVADHSYSPAGMTYATTYYWRVDEVNEAMDPAVWEGPVWSFSTADYAVVDDFESYNDSDAFLYESWVDGLTEENSGSMAGYLNSIAGTFGERTIINSGEQSMPVTYDNASKYSFSEVTRTFDTAQDWTANGIQSLCLYFRGVSGNTGQLYLKVNNTKVAYYGAATDIAVPAWLPWIVDLSAVGGNLNKVTKLTIGIEGSGSAGILYIDDVRLYGKAAEYITPGEPDTANLLASYQFEGNANDSSGRGFNGVITGGGQLVASGRPNGGSALQVSKAGYVDLGKRPAMDFGTTDWTVAAWFKTAMVGTGDANKGTVYGKGGDTAGGHRYCLIMSETTEGVVSLVTDDDVTKYVINSTSVTNDDEWHFVAGQREGTALRIYIDGILEGAGTATESYNLSGTSQHNAYIGAITDHTNNILYKLFNGLIDDVRVYDKALSQGEIFWLAGRTSPIAKPF